MLNTKAATSIGSKTVLSSTRRCLFLNKVMSLSLTLARIDVAHEYLMLPM